MRSQSAMEYLMTYGWAILIIAVVLGALYSLGLFNGSALAPRAQPSACQVFRPNGPQSTSYLSLQGSCTNELPEYVPGFGSSVNNYFRISTSPSLQSPEINSKITFSAWVYEMPNSACELGVAVFWPITTNINADKAYRFGASGGGMAPNRIMLEFVNTTGVQSNLYSSNTLPYSSWENIAATWNGATINFYLNGQPAGSTAYQYSVGSGTSNTFLIIGSNPNSGCDAVFPGYISNLQIYNTTLDANSVQALYVAGIGGAPVNLQNLVGWWPLNGNANDYSGNLNNGQTTGLVTYTNQWTSGYTTP